jgi:putative membrane protein
MMERVDAVRASVRYKEVTMDSHFFRGVAAGLVAVTAFGGLALAGDAELTSSTFVEKAGQAGLMEVELGKVAGSRSQDGDVRAFAQRMITDHSKANAELTSIARNAKVPAPTQLDSAHRAMVDGLSAKSGEDFDAEYARHMAMDHAKAVELFRSAAESEALDPALTAFAGRTLPTLESHKRMADELAASQQGSASGAAEGAAE